MSEINTDYKALEKAREKTIVQTSIIGIIANIFLVIFKASVGFITNSIAIILDAVNNLSDVLSSIVTIVGAKLAAKLPDKKHPLGHGRIEYLSSLLVGAIILYAGITAFIESIKKIINPGEVNYNNIFFIIVIASILIKFILGTYVKKKGKLVNSSALVGSGNDALNDALISISVLLSAIIYLFFNFSLEGYVGILISIFILKTGFEMTSSTVSDILGRRSDSELSRKIKEIINSEEEVRGTYDLMLYNYGPNKNYASAHIELPDVMNVDEVDRLTRRIQTKIFQETGVIMTGIGVYSYNTSNKEIDKIRNNIQKIVLTHDWALQMHGFYVDEEKKTIRFDVVLSFDIDNNEAIKILLDEMKKQYPDYSFNIVADVDISD